MQEFLEILLVLVHDMIDLVMQFLVLSFHCHVAHVCRIPSRST